MMKEKQLQVFFKDSKECWNRFAVFARQRKGLIALLAFAMLYLYGTRMFYYDVSFDGEISLTSQDMMLGSWHGINRFGLVVTKRLLLLNRFIPYTSNFLMVCMLGCSAFFLSFCIEEWTGRAKEYKMFSYLMPTAYISAPIFAEQFHFSLQAFEIAWASALCMFAVYAMSRWIMEGKSWLWAVPSVGCMAWAYGSYQVFAAYLIALVLICFILQYQNPSLKESTNTAKKSKSWFFMGVQFALTFCVGFVLYLVTAKLIKLHFHLDSDYVDSMVMWSTADLKTCIRNIAGDAMRIYASGWKTFYQSAFTPAILVSSCLFLYRGWKRKRKEYWVYVLAWIMLILSPMYLTIISASYQPIRGQIVYPLVFAFFLSGITVMEKKWLARVCCLGAGVVILHQGQTMTQLFHTAYVSYEQDKALAGKVYGRIEQVGADAGMEEYTVVFVGKKGTKLPEDALRGDVIGHSFFEWDNSAEAGSTKRISTFCRTLGYPMLAPSSEQVVLAKETAKTMPAWPASDSVCVVDDCIVVKLSEQLWHYV